MKMNHLARIVTAPLLMLAWTIVQAADSAAPTTCKDGTTSTATGRGACSGHGGVQKAATGGTSTSAPAAAAPAAAPAATPAPASAAPTASTAPTTAAKSAPASSKSMSAS